ncbi:hypothetical protein SVIO_058750 [Streptomyces violaceusniger]|uniref:Uncharacterized protein n=1 Tax=Streptomyces violaceusniger TaxID=68280 RepID=A0A4D4L2E4_STRVO|nr:hypothetical protein SVIO_058750 [Streptomyces violaceusniger]
MSESSSRSCSSAASKVTRSGTGCVRRREVDSTGPAPASHDLGCAVAEQIRRRPDRPHRQELADLGEQAANEYLSRAHAAAYRVGRDESPYGTHLGPTAANTEAVGIRVALGDYGRGLVTPSSRSDSTHRSGSSTRRSPG